MEEVMSVRVTQLCVETVCYRVVPDPDPAGAVPSGLSAVSAEQDPIGVATALPDGLSAASAVNNAIGVGSSDAEAVSGEVASRQAEQRARLHGNLELVGRAETAQPRQNNRPAPGP